MNSDVYFFGKLGSYYSQYPDDFTNKIFMKMGEWDTSADTYIAVHRKGELMYYGYVRKLEADRYIGFCTVLNGMMVTDFNVLFEIFDSILNHLAVDGEILKYSDSGEIVTNTPSLVSGKPVLNQVRALLKDGVTKLSDNLKGLPPESYDISESESKQFDLHVDDMPQIVSTSWNYCYTFIAKDCETPTPDSYQGVLYRLHKERKELEANNSDLSDLVLKLKRETKQQGVVILLGTTVVICFFILFWVKQSFNETQSDLNRSQIALTSTKEDLDKTKKQSEEMQSSFSLKISEKDRQIISLQQQNKQLTLEMEILKTELRRSETDNYNTKRDLSHYKNELQRTETDIKNSRDKISQDTWRQSQSTTYTSGNISKAIVTINTPIRTEPRHTASIKANIPKEASIEVFNNEYKNGYYKVKYRQIIGYVADVFINFKDTWRQSQSTTYTSGNISKAIVTINTPIRTEPRHTASIKANIPKEASIEVFNNEYKNGYYKVKYRQIIGYVADVFINFK